MTFSMEPGLFNPKGGYGYNPSDLVVVGEGAGYAMGTVPNLTKASPADLIKALENPNRHVRLSAQRLLAESAGN